MPVVTTPGPRVRAMLARHGLAVAQVVRLPGQGHGATFRLDLADGRRAKMRQFLTQEAAARVEQCLAALPPQLMPAVLVRLGRRLVVEYVEGTVLSHHLRRASGGERVSQVRATGRLLARLHDADVPPVTASALGQYQRVVSLVTARLVRRRLLDAAGAAALTTLPRPVTARMAVTHGDASPDNLVLTAAGGLLAIDEERVAVRPVAFDLARAVCRWPLDRDQERALLSAYARAGGDANQFRGHRLFWVATALSATAAYRMRYHPKAIAPIAAHLRRLAATAATRTPRPRR